MNWLNESFIDFENIGISMLLTAKIHLKNSMIFIVSLSKWIHSLASLLDQSSLNLI